MKTSFKKSLMLMIITLALAFNALNVTPAYAAWIFTNKTTANGLGNNDVFGIFVSGNNVYAATVGGGLSISSNGGSSFSTKTTADGLGNNNVFDVFVSGSNIYAATDGGLSISSDGGSTFTNKTTADGLGDNYIRGVFASGSNVYAATTFDGISISNNDGGSFSNKTTADGLGSNYTFRVFASGSNVYVATDGGLSISSDGGSTFSNKTTADGLGDNLVLDVFVSGSNVYAATNSGLSISSDGGSSFSNKTITDGLGDTTVYGVFVSGNNVYAATFRGLSISSNGGSSFINYTTANGLGNNSVEAVFVSGSTIYAATDGGVSIGADVPTIMLTLKSIGTQDGIAIETSENSNVGGPLISTGATFRVGDDAERRQYRGLLSFNTGASLPDNAVITAVTLKLKKSAVVGGGNPLVALQGFMLDVRKGFFSTSPFLQAADFQARGASSFGPFLPALVGGWYNIDLTGAKALINKSAAGDGLTQIRVRFKLDDNNNAIANVLNLYSGNAASADRPQLVITYH